MTNENIICAYKNLPFPFCAIENGKIIYVNDEFTGLVELPAFKLENTYFRRLIHPDSNQSAFDTIDKLETVCSAQSIDFSFRLNSNTEKYISVSAFIYAEGNKNYMYAIAKDSTNQDKLHNMLLLREEQFNDLLDGIDDEVTRGSTNFDLIYANKAYLDHYGVTLNELAGKKLTDIVIPEDRYLYEAIGTLTPQNPYYSFNCRTIRKDGSIMWLRCNGKAFFDKYGNVTEYQEVAHDITEFIRQTDIITSVNTELEKNLAANNEQLERSNASLIELTDYLNSILDHMSEGVIILNEQGDIELSNNYLKRNIGSDMSLFEKRIRSEARSEGSFLYELVVNEKAFRGKELFADNKKFHFIASGRPLKDRKNQRKGLLILQKFSNVSQLVNQYSGYKARFTFSDIITQNRSMIEMMESAKNVSRTMINILIEGESGTGKELLAQSIHNASQRSEGPFIAVNCGAIPKELIESELFGYEDGAFTGAKKGGHAGKFELAEGGTLFLDEIGELPLMQQVALLRVLQENVIVRVGGSKEIPVNARIICATNRNLRDEMHKGNFREDLFYRLNVVNFRIQPLRERKDDIPILVEKFLGDMNITDARVSTVTDYITNYCKDYSWPGNIRELQNYIQRTVYMSGNSAYDSTYMQSADVYTAPLSDVSTETAAVTSGPPAPNPEEQQIREYLDLFSGNLSQTARKLGISRVTLYKKLEKYNITVSRDNR